MVREKETFLVLGSNSFSGASFVDYVLRDNPVAEVVGISRSEEYPSAFLPYKSVAGSRFRFLKRDLNGEMKTVVDEIRDIQPDYVVNFAAQGMVGQSWTEPREWFQTNCLALMELVHALKQEATLKRFVQVSSPEIYGSCSGSVKEDQPLNPTTPYAASKACGDLSLLPYFKTFGFPVVFTRATNVYGPHQQLYRIVPRASMFVKMGRKIPLQGGGRAIKSYIHIRDVCDATLRIARHGRNGEIYHISPDGAGISIRDLVNSIVTKLGKTFEDCVDITQDRLGQDQAYTIDSEKIRSELGWRPSTSLETGLDETLEWIDHYYDDLKNYPQDYIHKP